MTKKIKKLVIPAAGFGTRFLPATKALAKEMLPIINIPAIQYIVEEAIDSGIEDIIIIVSSQKNSIVDYFDHSYELEELLASKNKVKEFELVKHISNIANIFFVRQKKANGLGDAIRYAKQFVNNEPFAVILGDDLVFQNKKGDKPALLQCIEAYSKYNSSIIGVQKVKKTDVSKYGIIKPKSNSFKNDEIEISDLVEKPSIDQAPSNYAILGRYVLTNDIFDALEHTKFDKSGEIQLTNALKLLLKNNKKIYAKEFKGDRFDIGTKVGYLKATLYRTFKEPDLKSEIKDFIKKELK